MVITIWFGLLILICMFLFVANELFEIKIEKKENCPAPTGQHSESCEKNSAQLYHFDPLPHKEGDTIIPRVTVWNETRRQILPAEKQGGTSSDS